MLQLRQGFRCRDSVLVWHEGPEAGGPEPRPGQRVELQIYQTVPLTPRQRRQQGTNLFITFKNLSPYILSLSRVYTNSGKRIQFLKKKRMGS
jgi:hypothetical protein